KWRPGFGSVWFVGFVGAEVRELGQQRGVRVRVDPAIVGGAAVDRSAVEVFAADSGRGTEVEGGGCGRHGVEGVEVAEKAIKVVEIHPWLFPCIVLVFPLASFGLRDWNRYFGEGRKRRRLRKVSGGIG